MATGEKGYLLSNLLKLLDYTYSKYPEVIFQFGSPIDASTSENKHRLITSLLETEKLVNIANQNHAKLVFASSEVVNHNPENDNEAFYKHTKQMQECLITEECNKYVILRIPRVYSKSRNNGLMEIIRSGKVVNTDTEVEYIRLNEFLDWALYCITQKESRTFNYDLPKHSNTIKEISDWILN